MTPLSLRFVLVLLLTACVGSLAQEPTRRFPLQTSQVVQLLAIAGIPAQPGDVVLPAQLTTSTSAPRLTISAVEPAGESHLSLRITCPTLGECLPFFALVDLHNAQHAAEAKSSWASSLEPALPIKATSAAILHVGERAVLLLEDQHMRISIPVITIDTGKLGAEIRVASLDRKQTYRGVVTDFGVVRGALP